LKSNFYYSFFFLPPREKEALVQFYSYCRMLDDRIDQESLKLQKSDKIGLIQAWRDELNRTFQGNPGSPVTKKLYPAIECFHLSKSHFDEIINGMEMDILISAYPTFEELKLYCYRVASAVGLVCMEIFGDRSEAARESAIHLGIAFQLTNILRDLFSDLEKGRIYIPAEDFRRFDYTEEDLKKNIINVEFSKLIQFEIDRAKIYYEKAELGLQQCGKGKNQVIEVMRKTYFRLLIEIERNIWNLGRKEIALSAGTKMAIALKVWWQKRGP
jgi:phytoene synthase